MSKRDTLKWKCRHDGQFSDSETSKCTSCGLTDFGLWCDSHGVFLEEGVRECPHCAAGQPTLAETRRQARKAKAADEERRKKDERAAKAATRDGGETHRPGRPSEPATETRTESPTPTLEEMLAVLARYAERRPPASPIRIPPTSPRRRKAARAWVTLAIMTVVAVAAIRFWTSPEAASRPDSASSGGLMMLSPNPASPAPSLGEGLEAMNRNNRPTLTFEGLAEAIRLHQESVGSGPGKTEGEGTAPTLGAPIPERAPKPPQEPLNPPPPVAPEPARPLTGAAAEAAALVDKGLALEHAHTFLQMHLDDLHRAIQLYQEAIKIDPANKPAKDRLQSIKDELVQMAEKAQAEGHRDRAIDFVEWSLRLPGDHSRAVTLYGDMVSGTE